MKRKYNYDIDIFNINNLYYMQLLYNNFLTDLKPYEFNTINLLFDNTRKLSLARKWYKNYLNRLNHMKLKLDDWFSKYECCFLSMTYRENSIHLANNVNIKRFLNRLNCDYIANVDYGSENERKHYHAIINIAEVPLEEIEWYFKRYGVIKVRRIKIKDSSRLSQYVLKLSQHGFKESEKLIYSKRKCIK